MKQYRKKYLAYLIDDLKNKDDCIEKYDQNKEKYDFLEPVINNSLFVNIDKIFEEECGVSCESLDSYDDAVVESLIKSEKVKLSEDDMNKLRVLYSSSKIEAYLVFGKIDELLSPTIEENVETESVTADDNDIMDLLEEVFATPSDGFSNVSTHAVDTEQIPIEPGKHRKRHKKVHSESSDKKKQEIGMVGEAYVYKELLKLHPDAIWVSGNAEKAGRILKGDDTCGYDIKYTDENGVIYQFPSELYRVELNPDKMDTTNFEDAVMKNIEDVAVMTDSHILIIDNLTYLCNASEKGDAAGQLMMRLMQLKRKHSLSILVLAHTPKRNLSSPITQNDLAGSKKLFNFFDSAFSIGKSGKDPNLRYIKQVKVRNGSFDYDCNNVIVCSIEKNGSFLGFITIGYAEESEHLKEFSPDDKQSLIDKVKSLHAQGMSLRQIAAEVGISHVSVSNYLKK